MNKELANHSYPCGREIASLHESAEESKYVYKGKYLFETCNNIAECCDRQEEHVNAIECKKCSSGIIVNLERLFQHRISRGWGVDPRGVLSRPEGARGSASTTGKYSVRFNMWLSLLPVRERWNKNATVLDKVLFKLIRSRFVEVFAKRDDDYQPWCDPRFSSWAENIMRYERPSLACVPPSLKDHGGTLFQMLLIVIFGPILFLAILGIPYTYSFWPAILLSIAFLISNTRQHYFNLWNFEESMLYDPNMIDFKSANYIYGGRHNYAREYGNLISNEVEEIWDAVIAYRSMVYCTDCGDLRTGFKDSEETYLSRNSPRFLDMLRRQFLDSDCGFSYEIASDDGYEKDIFDEWKLTRAGDYGSDRYFRYF